MKKIALLFLVLIMPIVGFSQEKSFPRQFFENLEKHAGKAYEEIGRASCRERV